MSDRQPGAELLTDLAAKTRALAEAHGLDSIRAQRLGDAVATRMADEWGGQQVYFPMDMLARNSERNAQIYRDFNGGNVADLAARHGLSIQAIYRILRAEREARRPAQHTLF